MTGPCIVWRCTRPAIHPNSAPMCAVHSDGPMTIAWGAYDDPASVLADVALHNANVAQHPVPLRPVTEAAR